MIKEAFTYMFKDNKFLQKAFVYFLFAFIANFFIQYASTTLMPTQENPFNIEYYAFLLLGTVLMFIPQGYYVSCVRALKEQQENLVLPYFNLINNFKQGFKFNVSIWLLCIAFCAISIVAFIIGGLLSVASKILAMIVFILVAITAIIFALAVCFYAIALTKIFTNTNSWLSFFKFKEATKIIANNTSNYMLAIGITIGISIVSGIISRIGMLLNNNHIAIPIMVALLTSIIASYTVFVFSYILAKWFKTE